MFACRWRNYIFHSGNSIYFISYGRKHWMVKLHGLQGQSCLSPLWVSYEVWCPAYSLELTLYWSVAGSTISRGLPFTLIRPFPLLQWATAVAVFCNKVKFNVNQSIISISGSSKSCFGFGELKQFLNKRSDCLLFILFSIKLKIMGAVFFCLRLKRPPKWGVLHQ